jgi:hypothetical protein
MNQLPLDTCRCTSPTCHVRSLCARFMDSPAGPRTPYADMTNECQDIGSERMFIPYSPTGDKLSPVEETPKGDK